MSVVEGTHQPDHGREQHAVAEHVARHVANPDNREGVGRDVVTQLAEVALDALPGALGRDAERLVVVAGGAARGVGVAQPVAVLDADLVGGVGQVGGALVGRDHQVGVGVAVQHAHLGRPPHLAGDDVVGQVEHAAHQHDVLTPLLSLQLLAVGRRPLEHEATLGTGRDDHGVLDHLCLHQAQDLGAVVLQPVRPADAAAGDEPTPQVHALHLGRVHEDLPPRYRLGHAGNVLAAELEREVGQRSAGLERVRANGRQDHAEEAAQDAVVVQAGDGVQHARDLGLERARIGIAILTRRQPELEQPQQPLGDLRVADEGVVDVALGEAASQHLAVLAVGAQDRDLPP